jgi:hypothetical protein
LGLRDEHTPNDDPEPLGCSHVSLWRADGLSKNERFELTSLLSRTMQLVYGNLTVVKPDGE